MCVVFERHPAWCGAALAAMFCGASCHHTAPPPPSSPSAAFRDSVTADELYQFQADSTLAGRPLRHVFVYRNQGVDEMTLIDHDGIHTSCGCTDVQVHSRRLLPGASTDVSLEIDTSNRLGEVSESATLTWRHANGVDRNCQFVLSGNIRSAFVFNPPELNFSKRDVREGTTKAVRIRSDLPIDWQRSRVHAEQPYVELVNQSLDTASKELTVLVRCLPTNRGETRRGLIHVFADPVSLGKTQDLTAQQLHSTLPVFSNDLADIRLSPRAPQFWLTDSANRWTGYLIVTGDLVESGAEVTAVNATNCHVCYLVTPLGKSAMRVDMTITGPLMDLDPKGRQLQIVFDDQLRHFAPIRLVTKQIDLRSTSVSHSFQGDQQR